MRAQDLGIRSVIRFMRIPRLALVAIVATVTLCEAPALAAPNRTTTLSSSALTFAWDGGPGNGIGQNGTGGTPVGFATFRCTQVVYECDDTLVELKEGGALTADIKAGSGSTDLDVRIIKSDSAGTADPAENGIAFDEQTTADAKATAKSLKPGFYVVRVLFFNATQGTYKGTLTFAPPPPPAPVVAPAPVPAPAVTKPAPAKKKTSKKAACQKKAKKIKNKSKRKKALKRCAKLKG